MTTTKATSKAKSGADQPAADAPDTEQKAASDAQSGTVPANAGDPGFLGNTGPGTGVPAEAEQAPRMPAQQPVHAESGPIYPTDTSTQIEPEHGYADSSTNPTYAAAGGRTIAGEDHKELVGADGKALKGDLFDDSDPTSPYVTVKAEVQEKFTYANAPDHPETRLLFNKGQRVERYRAAQITAALDAEQEPTFEAQRGNTNKGTRQS